MPKSRQYDLKGHYELLWEGVHIEAIYFSAWIVLLIANAIWGTAVAVAELRLLGIHVLMPLTSLLAIEYVFKMRYEVSYLTRLTWIVPTAVTVVTDLTAVWLLYHTWHEEHISLISLSGANLVLGILVALTGIFFFIVLCTTQYKHSELYEVAKEFNRPHPKEAGVTFERVVLGIAIALGVIGLIAIVVNLIIS